MSETSQYAEKWLKDSEYGLYIQLTINGECFPGSKLVELLSAYRADLLRELAKEAASFAWTKTGEQIAEWLQKKAGEK